MTGNQIHKQAHQNSTTLIGRKGIPLGSTITTLHGELPIEHLAVGDWIVTCDKGAVKVTDIRYGLVKTDVVRVKRGSLGHHRPTGDIVLPADQEIVIRDWRAKLLFGYGTVASPISRFVDGQHVLMDGAQDIRLFQITVDRGRIIQVNGLELLSANQHFHL